MAELGENEDGFMVIGAERHRRSGRSARKSSGVEDRRDCVTVSTLANYYQQNAGDQNKNAQPNDTGEETKEAEVIR